LFANEV